MYHGLQYACLIEDKEISVINENYKRSKTDDTNDDNMESRRSKDRGRYVDHPRTEGRRSGS